MLIESVGGLIDKRAFIYGGLLPRVCLRRNLLPGSEANLALRGERIK